jgi:ABC-type xylose transport system substrate-binding protein
MDEFEAERKWAEKQFLTELRDDFAMAAITGILAGKWGQMPQYKPEQAFADFAYRIADEMIKRRTQDVDDETK